MFWSKNKKNVYPCKPQFYYIKVGCNGVFVTRTCFRNGVNDEISFQNVYAYRAPVKLWIRGMLITYCVCDFLFYGYPCMKKENMML